MTQPNLSEPHDPVAVEDDRQQARVFLGKAREYLAADDLHQASEKGWGAAAWMAKAVAETQGWEYNQHAQFGVVLRNVGALTADDRIRVFGAVAYELHQNFYTRKRFLDDRNIGLSLENIAELLDALEPLTTPANQQANN